MTVHSIHAPFYVDQIQESWFSISELHDDRRRRWLSEIERAASALAEKTEYEFLVVHAGTWREDDKEDAPWTEAVDRSLTRLCDFCQEMGIKLALENIDTRFATTRNIQRVIERLDPGVVGICLDTNHANLNEDPVEAVNVCGNRLFTLHISDNFGDGDDHKLPFQGGIDWYGFVEALHRNRYEGVFMMELRNYGEMTDTLSQARERFEKLEAHYRRLVAEGKDVCARRSR